METYRFTQDCMTGIEQIDNEHRMLFQLINQLSDALAAGNSHQVLAEMTQQLTDYAATHFAHEEAYMEKIHDPELPRQKKEHAAFTARIAQMTPSVPDAETEKQQLSGMLEYLTRWLYHHILGSDIMIGKIKGSDSEEQGDPFVYTKAYETGISMIDEEHKKLFEIIAHANEVIHAQFLHDKYDEIIQILKELREYTVMHFHDEEEYMESIQYEGLEVQKRVHEAFVDKLNSLDLSDMENRQDEYLDELLNFLLDWLKNHIMKMDKKIPQR